MGVLKAGTIDTFKTLAIVNQIMDQKMRFHSPPRY